MVKEQMVLPQVVAVMKERFPLGLYLLVLYSFYFRMVLFELCYLSKEALVLSNYLILGETSTLLVAMESKE